MKICLINNLFRPYQRGGAEQVVSLIADGLMEAGHELIIISTDPGELKALPDETAKIFRLNGWICSRFYHLDKLTKTTRLFWHFLNIFNLSSYLKIKRILAREKPELVLTHNLMGIGFLTPLAVKALQLKHCHTLHDIQLLHPSGLLNWGEEAKLDSLAAKLYQQINRWLFSYCQKVISPSDWLLQQHLEKRFFSRASQLVQQNPINSASTTHHQQTSDKLHQSFKFLFVGQLEPHKGLETLINAFLRLAADPELTIVGTGSQQAALSDLVKNQTRIKLLGRVENQQVIQLMENADCLVVPSLCYENSPTVINEALSVGLPIIAASIGGIPELLNEDDRLLFKPGDEQELIEKLNWAMAQRLELQAATEAARPGLTKTNLNYYLANVLAD